LGIWFIAALGGIGVAPHILYLAARWKWKVKFKLRPPYFRKWLRYPLYRRMYGPHRRSWYFGEGKALLPVPAQDTKNLSAREVVAMSNTLLRMEYIN